MTLSRRLALGGLLCGLLPTFENAPSAREVRLDSAGIEDITLCRNDNWYLRKSVGFKINPISFYNSSFKSMELSFFQLGPAHEIALNYCSNCQPLIRHEGRKIDLIYKYYFKKVQTGPHVNALVNYNWRKGFAEECFGAGLGLGVAKFTRSGLYFGASFNVVKYLPWRNTTGTTDDVFLEFFRLGYAFKAL